MPRTLTQNSPPGSVSLRSGDSGSGSRARGGSGGSFPTQHHIPVPVPVMPVKRVFPNEANIMLYGAIIPADEALPGIPFEVNSKDWLSMRHYFQLYNDNQKGK